MHDDGFRGALLRTLLAAAVCLAVVTVCYFWIDRPVAFFVHDRRIPKIYGIKWLTYPPPIVQAWSPLVIALVMTRRAWRPPKRCPAALFVACLSLIVADQFRTSLGDVCGRYWPETWFDNNPSLIGNGTYGFHPFAAGDDVGSFPSGHAARILGFATVFWIAMPRCRALLIVACAPMLVSLVAMDYHFVGDVVAGGVLGAIVGAYAARLAGLSDAATPSGEQSSADVA